MDMNPTQIDNDRDRAAKDKGIPQDQSEWHRSRLRRPVLQLPLEILRMIFLCALPPASLLDPTLHAGGRHSPWCMALRVKKALVLVCKAWWPVAMDTLYEEVMFRRPEQITAFIYALDSSTFDVESSVRSVGFLCFLPAGGTVIRDLRGILGRCPHLRSLTWDPCYWAGLLARPVRILTCPAGLTHLECGDTVNFRDLVSGLRAVSRTLRFLAFILPTDLGLDAHRTQLFQADLEILETLRMKYTQTSFEHAALKTMVPHWTMPRLRRLTVNEDGHHTSGLLQSLWDVLGQFCRTHCQRLDYLRLSISSHKSLDVQPLLDVCPALKHLVIEPNYRMPITHRTIKWVDVVVLPSSPQHTIPTYRSFFDAFIARNLPSLTKVRVLDGSLNYLPDLPYIIPPSEAPQGNSKHDNGNFDWVFPGVHICHRDQRLYRPDMAYLMEDVYNGVNYAFDGLWTRAHGYGRIVFSVWDDDSYWADDASASSSSDEDDTSSD
ncbi:hypothetical protein PLICRDRAFT_694282 [Plicaturopsis crispa FD-325 SS-3]|nr:hypothetical protein PLICRDRAFT_694282 [Plicaturopsis crispa FD-325 SS-3]